MPLDYRGVATFALHDGVITNYHILSNLDDILSTITTSETQLEQNISTQPILTECHTGFFNTIIEYLENKGIRVTFKQLECLCLWAGGKSDTEIADILGISARTVHYHQDKCKAALKAYNKHELLDTIKILNLNHILHECYFLLCSSKDKTS